MKEIREYCEEFPVRIGLNLDDYPDAAKDRWVIWAENEGGYNGTVVDLLDVIDWVKKNKPELLR